MALSFIVTGQKTENPLILLGQYSDDEVEEDATADSSLANKNEQVDGLIQEGSKDTNTESGADTSMQMADQQQTGEDSSAHDFRAEGESGFDTVTNSAISDGLNKQTVPSVQASGSVSLEHHAPTDVTSQWKMILHEESNQYYYWNTETGETSWEIPAVLTQTASAYGTGYNEFGPMVTDVSTLISGVEPSYLLPVQNSFTGTDCSTFPTVALEERNKSEDLYVKSLRTDGHHVESVVNTQPCQEDLARPENSDHVHTNFDTETATDLPSRLLSQSEGLLEKLRSLKRSHGNFHSNEQISKYILEVEVRHSDIKALILDTSPLLSFWLHTDKQLKRLEDSVNDEIYQLAKSAVMDEIAETNKSPPREKLVADANTESESEDSGREGEFGQSGKSLHSDESADVSGDGSPKHSQSHPAGQSDITPSTEKVGSPDVEDIDMDVDMEVEESVPVSYVQVIDASDGKMFTEPLNLHADVPPPPGEEWIPPPPSESEDVPLPPPDSYSEPIPPPPENGDVPPSLSSNSLGVPYSVPQSYMQQSSDYATQYSLSYPESNYQYIGNAVALDPNTQFYGHVDGSQVSLPSTFYYETVPGTSEVAPAAASASEAYYNFNGAAPLFPVISSGQSSLHHSGVASANYNIPSNSSTVAVPSSRSSDSAEVASLGTASQSTDVTGGSSLLAKGQTKVKRPKKRTVGATTSTLRSNKKVSSLVDKWKAAKEELNDSEEEDDDYGILDRKRQREIEEWKSRQIASGEAKDNANFQPIVGDWREKVKRKKERAEKSQRKADENSQKKADEKQQKPDLTKLSANLPSGWQAYWDESTKKVYYGNTSSSQTSWTRPTT
ncbi:PREDICTED: formin-binding protein 4-like isoform X2 [Camelina sativa]|uniref:Formin-binding protein 4-like isoform X2 n=1 Tax=Camelina sativa TaxID=90675 RepID=A0ABM0W3F2_CAMSA|nr:PREDICTED: formin-binding protein 4-like isoform X2 [Camelina sativa]XP_010465145.1 PREDICTED: formin-binding protein 4-like isoform X2 [Camelina sativa]